VNQSIVNFKKRKLDVIFLSLILGISILFSLKFISSNIGFDEGVYVWDGYTTLNGGVPYKDFLETKPIIIYFMNALGLYLFGINNFKILPLIISFTTIFILYIGLKRLGIKLILSFLLTIHYSFIIFSNQIHATLNDTETYGISFAIIGMSLLFWNFQKVNHKKWDITKYLSGIFFSLSILSKEPFIFPAISVITLSFYYLYLKREKHFLNGLGVLFLGGTTSLFIVFSYLLYNHALFDYLYVIKVQLIYSQSYSSQSHSIGHAIYMLYFRYFHPLMLMILFPFYVTFFYKYRLSAFSILSLLVIILGAYGISIGFNYFDHYSLIGTICVFIPAIFGALYLSQSYKNLNPKKKNIVVVFYIICLIIPLIIIFNNISTNIRSKYTKQNYLPEQKITDTINQYSKKGDYVLLKDNPFLYVVWDRKNPLKWSTMLDQFIVTYKGNNEQEKLHNLLLQIETNLPKIIYIPPSKIYLEQTKHLNKVIKPLINKYQYYMVYPDLYILPSGTK